mgnify:CR=1 FL=1
MISSYILEQILTSEQNEDEEIIGDEPLMFKITSLNGKFVYVGMHDSIIDVTITGYGGKFDAARGLKHSPGFSAGDK